MGANVAPLANQVIRVILMLVGLKNVLLWSSFTGVCLASSFGLAQTSTVQTYTLVDGSKLTDECPICGLAPVVVPLTGTFDLQMVFQIQPITRYQLTNILFRSDAPSGPQYRVAGSGAYQVGGEVAVLQQLFVKTEISNGAASVNALCVSTNGTVTAPWPRIQIKVDQTNSAPAHIYHLAIVAVPVPQLLSIIPDFQTGNVRLEWDAYGATVQVERASGIGGPYIPLVPITTNSSFTDSGALTNSSQFFYRLGPF